MIPKKKALFVVDKVPDVVALVIVLGTIALLFTYTVPWVQPEYLLRWLPNAVHNGIHLTFADWFRGVDSASYDGDIRPRFISYSLTVINAKFRLWLYDYFIPFPNLSLALLATVVLSPFLYFGFAVRLLGNRTAAFYATCLHLTSVGFISATSFQYHQGKTLVQPAALLLFMLLAMLHTRAIPKYFGADREDRKITFAILGLNFIGIAIDETYAIIACTGVVLCYRIFWPTRWTRTEMKNSLASLGLYFSPFLAFTLFVFALPYILYVLPHTRELFVSREYEFYFESLRVSAGNKLSFDWKLLQNIWQSIPTNIMTYYNTSSFFTQIVKLGVAVPQFLRDHADLGLVILFVVPVLSFARNVGQRIVPAVNEALTQNRRLWGLPAAFVVYFALSATVQQFHVGTGFPTGFFYGSLLSILLPLVPVVLMLRWKNVPAFIGKLGLVLLMIVSAVNGLTTTVGYGYSHSKYTNDLARRVYPNHTYPAMPQKLLPKTQFVLDGAPDGVLWSPSRERDVRNRLYSIWQKRRSGIPIDFAAVGPWDMNEYWFLEEMYYLQER